MFLLADNEINNEEENNQKAVEASKLKFDFVAFVISRENYVCIRA
jgi:hypothetical protein